MKLLTCVISVCSAWVLSAPAFAQGVAKPATSGTTEAKSVELASDKLPAKDGFSDLESVTGGSNVIDQQNVNGQQSGTSTLYNLDLSSDLNYRRNQQSVSNNLTVNESFSRTPALPRLIKSTDAVRFVSMYRYFFTSTSHGPFVRLYQPAARQQISEQSLVFLAAHKQLLRSCPSSLPTARRWLETPRGP